MIKKWVKLLPFWFVEYIVSSISSQNIVIKGSHTRKDKLCRSWYLGDGTYIIKELKELRNKNGK